MNEPSVIEQEEKLVAPRPLFRWNLAIPPIPLICLFFYTVLVLRMAWMCDDAYITMRTVANFVDGRGLVWNLGERVQTYTHPLWMLLLAAVYSVAREPFFAALSLSIVVSAVAMGVLLFGLVRTFGQAILCTVLLGFSHAFIDFSTSGLENPLSHLLLALFWLVYFRQAESPRRLLILTLLASLGAVNRLDSLLVFAPALVAAWWQMPQRVRSLPLMALGMLPLALWEIFSLIYYGFLFPNTAYAKLNTGISGFEFAQQGMLYLLDSLRRDPLTMLGIACCCGLAVSRPSQRALLPPALGALLYLAYVVRIGGDFMSGRFLSIPLFVSAVILAQASILTLPRVNLAAVIGVALLGIALPLSPWMIPLDVTRDSINRNGVADERDFYFPENSLINWWRQSAVTGDYMSRAPGEEKELAYSGKVMVAFTPKIGHVGFYINRAIYLVDPLALSDPLLARLPSMFTPEWRIGHFMRSVPDGYLATLASGTNRFSDARLGEYYAKLQLITRGPIFAAERWQAIWEMNTGALNYLIDADRYRYPDRTRFSAADVRPEANLPLQRLKSKGGIMIDFPTMQTAATVEAKLSSRFAYQVRYLRDGAEVARQEVGKKTLALDRVAIFTFEVPAAAVQQGYNHVWIFPLLTQDNAYFQSLRALGPDDGPALAVQPSQGWAIASDDVSFLSPSHIQISSPISQVVLLQMRSFEMHDPIDTSNRPYGTLRLTAMSGASYTARAELNTLVQVPVFVGKGINSFDMWFTTDRDSSDTLDTMRLSELSVAPAQMSDIEQFEHVPSAGGQIVWAAGWEPFEPMSQARWARSPATLWIYSSKDMAADLHFTPVALFDPSAPHGMGYQGSFDLAVNGGLATLPIHVDVPVSYPAQLRAGWNEVVFRLQSGNFQPTAYDPSSSDWRTLSFALRDLAVQAHGE